MKKYLIDSNVIIFYLRDDTKAVSFLDNLGKFYISSIIAGEVYQGAKNKKELKTTTDFFSKYCHIIPVNIQMSDLALELLQKYVLSHGLLILDALIAATAIEENLQLVTANTKHFKFVKGLKIINWARLK